MNYVFYTYADMVGGSHRSMFTLANGLRERGNKVIIVTPGEPPAEFSELFSEFHVQKLTNIKLRKRSTNGHSIFRILSISKKVLILLMGVFSSHKLLKSIKPDVLYFNDSVGVLCFGLQLLFNKYRRIYTSVLYLRSSKRPALLGYAAFLVDRIFFVSKDLIDMFKVREQKTIAAKFQVLNTGFSLPQPVLDENMRFKYRSLDGSIIKLVQDRKKILLLGSYDPRKGHLEALEMLSKIIRKHRPLLICAGPKTLGDGYVNLIEKKINTLSLSGDVLLLEAVEDIKYLFNEVDLTILPSKCEGLPRVLIESLSFGVRVVTFKVSGVNEILEHPIYGKIVSGNNIYEFTDSVMQVLSEQNSSGFNERAKHAVIENVRKKFDVDNYINKFESNFLK